MTMRKLLLLFFLTLLPLSASADGVEINGIYYNLESATKKAEVTFGNWSIWSYEDGDGRYSGVIEIPESVIFEDVSYSVTSIGKYAFQLCSDLTSVTIPNSVTSIGSDAFEGTPWYEKQSDGLVYIGKVAYKYKGLMPENTNIEIIEGTLGIAEYAFGYCTGLTSVSIPNSVSSIGEYAFYNCSGLTSIIIPNSVTSIGQCVFEGCEELTSVTISNSVTSIPSSAFRDCWNLTSVTIPNSVTTIEGYAFWYCIRLTSVTIPNSVTSIGEGAFSDCSGLTSLVVSNNVKSIPRFAFEGCSSLSSVTIPNSVTSIEGAAFAHCRGLTSVTIPNSVTSIGDYAFGDCSSLISVTIPNSVTTISREAFGNCKSLASVSIPNSVTSIGPNPFIRCGNLKNIIVEEGNNNYDSRNNCNAIIETNTNKLIAGCNNTIIDNSVSSIGDWAFYGCSGLTFIEIPNSVTSIGENAFYECSGLTSVTIPNSVTLIGGQAFAYCGSLISVSIPNSVTSIDQGVFSNCSGLISMVIPNSVTTIGVGVFNGCRNLTSVEIPNSVTFIRSNAFASCYGLSEVYCMATEVPTTESRAFSFVDLSKVKLYVPEGCIDKYAAIEPWKQFGQISERIDDSALFPDCPAGEIRNAAIYLFHKGIVKGEHGLLLADREATRAEVAKTSLYGAYFGPSNVPDNLAVDNYPCVYEDLQDKSTYYYRSAKALLYLEYGDGITPFDRNRLKFEPEGKIARVNVLKVLMEAFNIKPDVLGTDNPFPNDEQVVNMAASHPLRMGYIRRAAELGIITKANEEFHPYKNCTRGQAFLMLARIMQKIEAGKIDAPDLQESAYFQPLNTTLKTIGLGASMQMGNFQHYTRTSFAMSGVVPLAFAHTYNSYNTTLPSVFFGAKTVNNVEETYQPLGDGWSHNYHSFITIVAEKEEEGDDEKVMKLIVHWGGGSIDVYKSEDGKLVPESMGIYDDLSLDGNEVVIKSKSQIEYRFSKQGSTGANVLYLYSIKDRNGNTLTINYQDGQNGNKRISSVSDGQRELKFSYVSGTDLLQEVKDPLNRTVSFTYFDNKLTGKKQLESFTDAENHTTTYEYGDLTNPDLTTAGSSKLLSRIKLPKGNYIENEYDANRRLRQTVNGLNGVSTTKTSVTVTADYNNGTASTLSDVVVERGLQTSSYHYTYNENNVVTSMTGAKNLFVNSTHDNANHPELPTAIQNNSTNVSGITYDERGNVLSIAVTGDGTLTTTMTYDEMNNLTSVTDPKNNTTTYTYDAKGNLIGVSAPEGVTTSITVDEYNGLPKEVKNAMGVITQYKYNKYGNVETVSLPALGLSSSAEYDAASRVTSTRDALGRTHSFVYNNNDYLTSETDAMKHTTSYAYDANDNLISITNAKNGVTTLSYDNATDWLLSVEFADAKKEYGYNIDGTLSSYTKPDGTTLSYSYDELGRIISDGVNSYSYDNKLRLSEISDGSKSISFEYDGFNRIIGTTYSDGHSNGYAYDDNGNCININGTEYGYDGLNRLTSVSFSGGTINYSYRKDSQLDKVEYPNGMTTSFGYDEVGRLTSKQTTLNNGTVVAGYSYTLDKVGNITEQTTQEPYNQVALTNEEVSYNYNDGNRITQAGDISFEFDKNGNTTKRGSEGLAWDVQDRLTVAGSTAITYDPLGLIASYGDITFTTDPLGMGNVLSDSKSGAEYIYGNGLEARVKDGKVSYYVTDVRGSVVAIVDKDGNITHKYQYDDFGKVIQKEELDYNPFRYVGKYGVMALNDHLYYMRARHYDPTIGRFLSEDPIWSTNLYPYADNNPIMGIDPKGLETTDEVDAWYHKEHWNNKDLYDSGKFRSRDEYIATQNKLDADYLERYEKAKQSEKKAKQPDEELQDEPTEVLYVGSPSQKSYKINPNDYINVLNKNNPLLNSNGIIQENSKKSTSKPAVSTKDDYFYGEGKGSPYKQLLRLLGIID